MLRSLLVAVAFVGLAAPAAAQGLTLVGADGKPVALTAADLAVLPRQTLTFAGHGESHVYEGPLLIDVLAKAGAPTGKALHGAAMSDAVLVEAHDGYAVALGLAEADPGTRPNRIILADSADGAPLGPQDGPYKLVVEGDLRPARAARMVERITLLRLVGAVRSAAAPSR